MPGDFQKGARKRFACSAPQSRIVLTMLLFVLYGSNKSERDFMFS